MRPPKSDAFAGGEASFDFVLRNDSSVDRPDVEMRCMGAAAHELRPGRIEPVATCRGPGPATRNNRIAQFELRTRYPFGWFHAWTYVQGSITVYVAPSPSGHRNPAGRVGAG